MAITGSLINKEKSFIVVALKKITKNKKLGLLSTSNLCCCYVPPQLGRFTPLVVQYAFGLWSPEPPLQSPVPGQTLCLGLAAKTVLANAGAITRAAEMTTIANVIILVFIFNRFIEILTI